MKDPIERFMDKVFKTSSCWIWIAAFNHGGYGLFRPKDKMVSAHRWIYEYTNGPLNELMCLHKCNNTSCVNPDHLYAGNQFNNMDDCVKSGRNLNLNKTHCPMGHEYSNENVRMSGTRRNCRICGKQSERKSFYYKNKPTISIGTREKININ